MPIGIGGTLYEREKDFVWLMEAFYECYSSIPACMIVDGDECISNAIQKVAASNGLLVVIILCIWHLFMAVVRGLRSNGVSLDEAEQLTLKKKLYGLQRSESEPSFLALWAKFLEAYGTTDKASKYLQSSLLGKKDRWAQHATGKIFSAGHHASSISESLHSLLSSGKSHFNKLHEIFLKIDTILITQLQAGQRRADKWEKGITKLDLGSGKGFAGSSASMLLSSQGWVRLGDAFDSSIYMGVTPVDSEDVFCPKAFRVVDGRFDSAPHVVKIVPPDVSLYSVQSTELERRQTAIHAALGKVLLFSPFFSFFFYSPAQMTVTEHGFRKRTVRFLWPSRSPVWDRSSSASAPRPLGSAVFGKIRPSTPCCGPGDGPPKREG